jgi:dienelactone hydrolase
MMRCAVIYYGSVMKLNGEFPKDFGMLAVRAGKDYPGFSDHMYKLTDWAQEQGVEVTLIDYPEATHSFDTSMDTPRTREIIGQTLAFLQEKLQVEK